MEKVPETLLDIQRVSVIMNCLLQTRHLEGDIAEVGVYKGGVAYYLNKLSHGKQVYLFDTFEGIPMKSDVDRHIIGDFNDTSLEEVSAYFVNEANVHLVKGIFPNSASDVLKDTDKFSFVHLDADQYESTLNSLKYFYPKMVTDGIIVCDDYKFLDGVDKAIREFLSDKEEKEIHSTNMQCVIVKK